MNHNLVFFAFLMVNLNGCAISSIQIGDPQWNPAFLEKNGCPNIEGEYLDKGLLSRQFGDVEQGLWNERPLATRVIYRDIPMVYDQDYFLKQGALSETDVRSAQVKEYAAQQRVFDEEAITSIQKNNDVLEIKLKDKRNIEYLKITMQLNHVKVGCYKGALIVRNLSVVQGGEGSYGTVYAGEAEFRKLNDGSLQIRRRSREWLKSMALPPRQTETILVFPKKP